MLSCICQAAKGNSWAWISLMGRYIWNIPQFGALATSTTICPKKGCEECSDVEPILIKIGSMTKIANFKNKFKGKILVYSGSWMKISKKDHIWQSNSEKQKQFKKKKGLISIARPTSICAWQTCEECLRTYMTTSTLPSYRKTETFIIVKKGKDAEQIKSAILTYIYTALARTTSICA